MEETEYNSGSEPEGKDSNPDPESSSDHILRSRPGIWPVAYSLTIVVIICLFLYAIPALQEIAPVRKTRLTETAGDKADDKEYRKMIGVLEAEIRNLKGRYNSFTPGQSFMVINTTENRFMLYRNRRLVREGFCSSGSYTVLEVEGERKWTFKTPKGKYFIHGKSVSPVWRKPDWAFVEEGVPVPPANHPSRWEYGVLGDYALSIGNGYLIHGTIYKRFLGMPVTHGCIRLNDEDLEAVYRTLSIGSRVYIF